MAKAKTSDATEQVTIVESLAGVSAKVDSGAGVIRGVKLIGFESKNGRYYGPDVLKAAVRQYEGVKVNVDHPTEPGKPRSVKDRIGVIKNARFEEGKGVYGDFHFNPKHQLAEQIAWDAENNPEAVGFSHNATLKFAGTTRGKRNVESIVGVRHLDLVADPATTNGIFEHEEDTEGLLSDKAKVDQIIGAACDMLSEVRYGSGGKLSPDERSQKAVAVARDLIAELAPTSQESDDMDLSKLTVEELESARPDLVKAVTEQQAESQELEQLKAKVKAFEQKEAQQKLEGEIRTALEAAGLDPKDEKQVSKVFFEQLVSCTEADARKALIDDRKALVGAAGAGSGKGTTRATEGEKPRTTPVTEGAAGGASDWLKRLKSPARRSA